MWTKLMPPVPVMGRAEGLYIARAGDCSRAKSVPGYDRVTKGPLPVMVSVGSVGKRSERADAQDAILRGVLDGQAVLGEGAIAEAGIGIGGCAAAGINGLPKPTSPVARRSYGPGLAGMDNGGPAQQ